MCTCQAEPNVIQHEFTSITFSFILLLEYISPPSSYRHTHALTHPLSLKHIQQTQSVTADCEARTSKARIVHIVKRCQCCAASARAKAPRFPSPPAALRREEGPTRQGHGAEEFLEAPDKGCPTRETACGRGSAAVPAVPGNLPGEGQLLPPLRLAPEGWRPPLSQGCLLRPPRPQAPPIPPAGSAHARPSASTTWRNQAVLPGGLGTLQGCGDSRFREFGQQPLPFSTLSLLPVLQGSFRQMLSHYQPH